MAEYQHRQNHDGAGQDGTGADNSSAVPEKGVKNAAESRISIKKTRLSSRVHQVSELFAVVIAILGDFGIQKETLTAAFGVDFFGRKNEPGRHWLWWPALHFVQVADGDSGVELGLPVGDAF